VEVEGRRRTNQGRRKDERPFVRRGISRGGNQVIIPRREGWTGAEKGRRGEWGGEQGRGAKGDGRVGRIHVYDEAKRRGKVPKGKTQRGKATSEVYF